MLFNDNILCADPVLRDGDPLLGKKERGGRDEKRGEEIRRAQKAERREHKKRKLIEEMTVRKNFIVHWRKMKQFMHKQKVKRRV